jgi:hypothetical protein
VPRESGAIVAIERARVGRDHDKAVSIEQKGSMRSCLTRACIRDYRSESPQRELADELL